MMNPSRFGMRTFASVSALIGSFSPMSLVSARTTAELRSLGVNMGALPLAVDRPARDAVVVLAREGRDGRDRLGLAALGHDLGAGRLRVAGLVPRAALQDCRPAIPVPGHAEAGKSLAQHRRLQRRLPPALTAVGRNHDF